MGRDQKIMIKVTDKDPQSLEILYNRYSPLLWKISFRATKCEASAEKIVQSVFHHIWNSPQHYDTSERLSLVILQTCKDRIKDLSILNVD